MKKYLLLSMGFIFLMSILVGCAKVESNEIDTTTDEQNNVELFNKLIEDEDYTNAAAIYKEASDNNGDNLSAYNDIIDNNVDSIISLVSDDYISIEEAISLLNKIQQIGYNNNQITDIISKYESSIVEIELINLATTFFDEGEYNECIATLEPITESSEYYNQAMELIKSSKEELEILENTEGNTIANANVGTRIAYIDGILYYLTIEGNNIYFNNSKDKYLVFSATTGEAFCSSLNVVGNYAYLVAGYQTPLIFSYSTYFDLYKMKIDGSSIDVIQEDVYYNVYVKGSTIYYIKPNSEIVYKMGINGEDNEMIYNGAAWSGFNVTDEAIYIGIDDYSKEYNQKLLAIKSKDNIQEIAKGEFLKFFVSELDNKIYYGVQTD